VTDGNSLFPLVDAHFLAAEALARVRLFSRLGRDAAGWFKGGLAFLFHRLATDGKLEEWRANVPLREDPSAALGTGSRQRCDFRVVVDGSPLWVEVKAIPQRQQGGGRVHPGFYLHTGGAGDITEDLVKLMRVPDGDTPVLLFAHLRPEAAGWAELLSAYARRIAPIAFAEKTSISDYPEELYICKLALSGGF